MIHTGCPESPHSERGAGARQHHVTNHTDSQRSSENCEAVTRSGHATNLVYLAVELKDSHV